MGVDLPEEADVPPEGHTWIAETIKREVAELPAPAAPKPKRAATRSATTTYA